MGREDVRGGNIQWGNVEGRGSLWGMGGLRRVATTDKRNGARGRQGERKWGGARLGKIGGQKGTG